MRPPIREAFSARCWLFFGYARSRSRSQLQKVLLMCRVFIQRGEAPPVASPGALETISVEIDIEIVRHRR